MSDSDAGRAAFVFSIIDRMRVLNGKPTIDERDVAFLDSFMATIWHDRPQEPLPHAEGAFSALRRRLFDHAAPRVSRVVCARGEKDNMASLPRLGEGRLSARVTRAGDGEKDDEVKFQFEIDDACSPSAWLQGAASIAAEGNDIVVAVPACSAQDGEVFLWVERHGADENYHRRIRDLLVASEWAPESGEGPAFRPIDSPFYRRRNAGPMASLFARYVIALPSDKLPAVGKSPSAIVRFRIRDAIPLAGLSGAMPTLLTNPFLICATETISEHTLDVAPATSGEPAYVQLPATTIGPTKDFWTQPDVRKVSMEKIVFERRSSGVPDGRSSWEYEWPSNRIVVRPSGPLARTAKVTLRICPDLADAEELILESHLDGVGIDAVSFDPARHAYKSPFSADCLSMEVTSKHDLSTFLKALDPFGLNLRFDTLSFETRLGVDTPSDTVSGAQVIHYVLVPIVGELPVEHVTLLERLLTTAIASVATTDAPIKFRVVVD